MTSPNMMVNMKTIGIKFVNNVSTIIKTVVKYCICIYRDTYITGNMYISHQIT